MSTTSCAYEGGSAPPSPTPDPRCRGAALTSSQQPDGEPSREERTNVGKCRQGSTQVDTAGSSDGFATLWNAWKNTACSLHRSSRMAVYPSLPGSLLVFLPVNKQSGDYILPSHFPDTGEEHIPARAVISYQDFKKVREKCPAAFGEFFSASVFSSFLRDTRGDISSQTFSRNLLNCAFNVHVRENFLAFMNCNEDLSKEALAGMFYSWAQDSSFVALHAVRLETDQAHPGLLDFFCKYWAERLLFCLDRGRRGFVSSSDLLDFDEFQQLLSSLHKPIGSPLGDIPPQWSVQFAYDIFNFLRENAFLISRNVVAELLEALRQAVCPYTYDVTPYVVQRLFAVKATSVGRCGAMRWGKRQEEDPLLKENTGTTFLNLEISELIQFLAALDYTSAVWSPAPIKSRVASPSCVSSSLRFLWDLFDVQERGFIDAEDLSIFWEPVATILNSRGFPVYSLARGSVESELLDRCGAVNGKILRQEFVSNHTEGRVVSMMLMSPAFFQIFDQRERCPGAPLVAGDYPEEDEYST